MLYTTSPELIYLLTKSLYALTDIFPFTVCLPQSLVNTILFPEFDLLDFTYEELSLQALSLDISLHIYF